MDDIHPFKKSFQKPTHLIHVRENVGFKLSIYPGVRLISGLQSRLLRNLWQTPSFQQPSFWSPGFWKKKSQRNKRTTTNTETQCQCRVWIWTASQGGWPTWANMPWDRRKPCAMPPQWCHKSPVDVKQFYNMTAPNWGSSLSISSWIHMNVSQTTNISTHWLMIPSQVINQWATSVVYGWYWVVTVSLCKCWSSCPGRNWRTAWWSSTLQDPGPDPRRGETPMLFSCTWMESEQPGLQCDEALLIHI